MEENKQIESPKIDIIKPVVVEITVNGKAKVENGNYMIRWFDNTNRIVDNDSMRYTTYDFMEALQQVTTLYQLNNNTILSIKLKTI